MTRLSDVFFTLAGIAAVSIVAALAVGRLLYWLGSFYLPLPSERPEGQRDRPGEHTVGQPRGDQSADAA